MKLKVTMVNRQDFDDRRYKNFLKKKEFFGGTEGDKFRMTDLDRDYGDGVMKDVVLCDGCMQNILEPEFVMLEEQLVYHTKCCEARPNIQAEINRQKARGRHVPQIEKEPEPIDTNGPLPDNVIRFPGTGDRENK